MKTVRFETKELNDTTIKQAAAELKVGKEYVSLKVVDEKKTFLNINRTYTVEACVNFDVVKDSVRYLQEMLATMEIEAVVEAKELEDHQLQFTIDAAENPLLIGKSGKTLESIQTLIKNLINVFTDEHYVVTVDVGGYKEQRRKQLEILATKTAKDVARTHVPARLVKMNAYERRIIHTKLADWRDVTTESEGEEPNRYVVIKPRAR